MIRRRASLLVLTLAAFSMGVGSGCYSSEFNAELSGVYACESDTDCSDDFSCLNQVCVDARGPQVSIIGPEEFQAYAVPENDETFTVILSGTDLTLAEPGGANVDGEGHVVVSLDGTQVDTLTLGSLVGNPSTQSIPIPTSPGIHRVTAVARQNDGTRYENPGAETMGVFWVDDGRPHVGFRSPWPDSVLVADEEDNIEANLDLVSINFGIRNPEGQPPEVDGEGHLHILFNKDVPNCIGGNPDCNGVYVSAVFPSGGEIVNRVSPNPNPLSLPPSPPANYNLAVVAEFSNHEPYRVEDDDSLVFETINILVQ